MIEYITYSIVFSAISYTSYRFLLKNEKTFQFNRYFLIGTLLLSVLLPLVEIESSLGFDSSLLNTTPTFDNLNTTENLSGITTRTVTYSSINFKDILFFIYSIIASILLFRFSRNLYRLYQLISKSEKQKGALTIVYTNTMTLYSFFHYLIINKAEYQEKGVSEVIMQHELVHAKEWHSIDIIIAEFLKCIVWFNPFIWLIKNEISENHEYIADDKTIQSGIDKTNYLNTLINQYTKTSTETLGCGFSFIQTKNRIKMMNRAKSNTKKVSVKIAVAFALISATFVLISFKPKSVKTTTIILNAGHGGHDSGAESNGVLEKDITLKFVEAFQESVKGNRSIILKVVRSDDQFISLEDRVTKINSLKGDLLIDLHLGLAPIQHKKGIEIFYSTKNTDTTSSIKYATSLAQKLVTKDDPEIDLIATNFKLLHESKCPTILLKFGFISNDGDRKLLQSDAYIKDLANKTLDGILSAQNDFEE
jgi:N-acetylmuramoyl-L-alanine amidase